MWWEENENCVIVFIWELNNVCNNKITCIECLINLVNNELLILGDN